MGVRRFEDLEAWQLATALKREVYALTHTGSAARDFKFRDQIRESAASAPRNIAEGFGRYRPASFVLFLEIAIGSVMETDSSLLDGVDRQHFSVERIAEARVLVARSLRVMRRLLLHLKRRQRDMSS